MRIGDGVVQMHSTAYRSPESVPDERVLVVGGGNTGFQIAQELSASRDVHLSIGSRQMPLPQRVLGRDLFWFLEKTGLLRKTLDSRLGRRMAERDTLIGSTPRRLRKRYGVELHARAVSAHGSSVQFADDSEVDLAGVVWATGFRVDHSWIDAAVFDADGRVIHQRGITHAPGLYFLGMQFQHTRGSALLGWVKDDAEYIAGRIEASRAASFIPETEIAGAT